MIKNPDRSTELAQLKQNLDYSKVVGFALFFIGLGTVFYHFVEKLSWLDAVYFTVVTIATVGYGDITPKTGLGKIFTIFYIFVGIVLFVALARIVISGIALKRYKKRNG